MVAAQSQAQSEVELAPSMPDGLCTYLPESLSIMVIGDVCLDEYVKGGVSRVGYDIPVPVLRPTGSLQYPGGAANVAQNLACLGPTITVELLSTIGDDDNGSSLMRLLSKRRVHVGDVQIIKERHTTHKWRAVAQMGHQLLRIDRESTEDIPRHVQESLLAAIQLKLPHFQGIVCSDYNKGCLTPWLLQGIIHEARRFSIPVIIDPKGTDPSRYAGASILKPNLLELQTLTSMPVDTQDAINSAASTLLSQTSAQALLVTRGQDGVSIYIKDRLLETIPARPGEGKACDVTGAGDTFIAAFSLAHCGGAPLLVATQIANIAASMVVRKPGTATISRSELLQQLSPRLPVANVGPAFHGTQGKMLPQDCLLPRLDAARRAGSKLIFTNGCFDLLHAGHIQLLEAAKMLGGVLIVGLNTDASVRRLKGRTRPVIVQACRGRVLSALACVDFVVLFDELTPRELIRQIMPDILVKGADYVGQEVVGRDLVEERGGRVELLPLLEDVSTTGILKGAIEMYMMG